MTGPKLLFLAILDEFKTLIFPRRSAHQHVEPEPYQSSADEVSRNVVESGPDGSDASRTKQEYGNADPKWYKTKEGWDFVMRRLVEVFTIGAVIIYFYQMQANRRQAEAAEHQLREMVSENLLSERAWVNVTEVKDDFTNNIATARIIVFYKNTGKTPALHVHGTMGVTIFPDILRKRKTDLFDTPHTDDTLAPEGVDNSSFPIAKIQQFWAEEIAKGIPFYVYGTVWYDDIFGLHHWTQFCFVAGGGTHGFQATDFHNESDEAVEHKSADN